MKSYFLSLSLLAFASSLFAQTLSEDIRLNQIGFFPASEKTAAIISTSSSTFEIKIPSTLQTVYTSDLSSEKHWNDSDEDVKLAVFTDFDATGDYVLYVADKGISHEFEIGNLAINGLARGTLKALYFNRASTALEETYAGAWHRPLGHPDNEVVVHPSAANDARPAGTIISTPKGWYDAGDYNKYIVNSGISVFTYLAAYEAFPAYYDTLNLNIPESDNNIPDILDEALWNIEWMATMQDPNDGGVYNKTTTANFQGAVMPHQTNATRYVVSKGTAATLDFAAVMAMAARIYEPYDAAFAANCLEQAEYAWSWAQSNPNVAFNNPGAQDGYPAVGTGGYGDSNFQDEFFWARTELYITTKNDDYYPTSFSQNFWAPGWSGVQTLALLSLTTHRDDLTSRANYLGDVQNRLTGLADQFVNTANANPYHVPSLGFWWGSNSGIGNAGVVLLFAYELTGEQKYYDTAIDVLDYLVGRNATTYSFVTGFGDKTPMHIHHRQSEADDVIEPVPGFLAGGPNPGNQDQDCGASAYPSSLPAKSYVDDWCSYSTNEITINWNAPIAFVSGGLQYIYLRDFQRESTYELPEPLGLGQNIQNRFDIYPNPASEQIRIDSLSPITNESWAVLYGLDGQQILQQAISPTGSTSITIGHLKEGVYVLKLGQPDQMEVRKIVVSRS